MKEQSRCCVCGCKVSPENTLYVEGKTICKSCAEKECFRCINCNELIFRENDFGDKYSRLCQDCYNNNFYHCTNCLDLIHADDVFWFHDNPFCKCCYHDEIDEKIIHRCEYKPKPIFYGNDTNRYYGVELEIDTEKKYIPNAEKILDIANFKAEHIYIKNDGSLKNGFEIVSHPMSLDYHINKMAWKSVLQTAKNLGYYSHDTSTCGYHIHINKKALGNTIDEQEEVIGKIMYFIELHWNRMLKFSRRTENNIKRWANRFGYEKTSKQVFEKALYGSNGKYVSINIKNYSTIEIRIFRGTLNYNTFIATLQLVDKIVDIALHLTDDEINKLSWNDFVATIKETELIQYLKECNLYIDSPICIENFVNHAICTA